MPFALPTGIFFTELFSVSAVITYRKVKRDLLISTASLNWVGLVALLLSPTVCDCLSLPARSTNCNLLTIWVSWLFLSCYCTINVKMQCDLLLELLILCADIILFFKPFQKYLKPSSTPWHSKPKTFSIVTSSVAAFILIFRPGTPSNDFFPNTLWAFELRRSYTLSLYSWMYWTFTVILLPWTCAYLSFTCSNSYLIDRGIKPSWSSGI